MDFLGIERERAKEMGGLMNNRSNSEAIQKDQAEMNVVLTACAAQAKYNTKDAVGSDGSWRNYFCEKGSFTSQLRLGLPLEEQCNEEKVLPSWIRTVNGGTKQAVAAFRPRDLEPYAVENCLNSARLFPNQSGIRSPIRIMGRFEHRTSSDNNQDGCSGRAASMIPSRRSGSQLTILYGGIVNVYEDIPADKAQAIMLVASSGNNSSYPQYTKVKDGRGSQIQLKTSLPFMKLLEGSGIDHQPSSFKEHIDLPVARKHSLQRFLEKRKDRLNANSKSPYTAAEAEMSKPQHHTMKSPFQISLYSNSPP